jgi:hypothetical protein
MLKAHYRRLPRDILTTIHWGRPIPPEKNPKIFMKMLRRSAPLPYNGVLADGVSIFVVPADLGGNGVCEDSR